MTMRECINICVRIQRQSWTAPTDYAKRTAATDQRTREDAKR